MTFLPRWLVIVGALVIAVPLLNAGLGGFIFGVAFVVKGSYAFAAAALPLGLPGRAHPKPLPSRRPDGAGPASPTVFPVRSAGRGYRTGL